MFQTFHYGGQALIEGVMIRGQRSLVMAVRCPGVGIVKEGEISVSTLPLATIYTGRIRRIPFLRGIVVLIEALVLGIRALSHSASISMGEEETKMSGPTLWGILALSLSLAVGLFFIAPLFLVSLINPYLDSVILSSVVEGVIRIAIFLLYLGAMNLLPDVRRVFAYHGAEHKVVNAYENNEPLEVARVKKYSTAHARCGTAFILAVLVISIIVFAFTGEPVLWLHILSRIILIPVIAAISYEITQFAAAHINNRLIYAILIPGLALQSLTTRQPDDSQLEVGIAALSRAIEMDKEPL